jgi:hypothetical protein
MFQRRLEFGDRQLDHWFGGNLAGRLWIPYRGQWQRDRPIADRNGWIEFR